MTQWIMTQQTGQTEAVMHAAVLGVILRLPPWSPICRSRVLDTATMSSDSSVRATVLFSRMTLYEMEAGLLCMEQRELCQNRYVATLLYFAPPQTELFCKCVSDVLTHAKDVTIEMTPFASLRLCVKLENKNAKTRGRKDAEIE